MSDYAEPVKAYKDRMFIHLFSERNRLLQLYNAVCGTDSVDRHADDPENTGVCLDCRDGIEPISSDKTRAILKLVCNRRD